MDAPVEDAKGDGEWLASCWYPAAGVLLRYSLADNLARVDVKSCLREPHCKGAVSEQIFVRKRSVNAQLRTAPTAAKTAASSTPPS